MAILNYTTRVSVRKTASEIQEKLAKAGAQAILCEYDDDALLTSISFRLRTEFGLVNYKLPARIDGVYERLKRDRRVPKRLKTREQAIRVAWRIIKDWMEAQIAIVEAGVAEVTEVLLPYAQNPDGKTVHEHFKENGMKMLTHKDKS